MPNSSQGKGYSFNFLDENYLLDSAFVNRKLVLEKLTEYVNNLSKIWKNSIEKKPKSFKWWAVSLLNRSIPNLPECEKCLENLITLIGQLSQALKNPSQFTTYLNAFVKLATDTTLFEGSPAEDEFANLVNYLDKFLENDLKRAQTNSIEIPEISSDSANLGNG